MKQSTKKIIEPTLTIFGVVAIILLVIGMGMLVK